MTYKKVRPDRYFTHDALLDELIAFGWTDGIRRRIDDEQSRQLISPRRTRPWAKSYKDRVERLTAEGRMHPAGLAAVTSAKASGMWDAMNDVDALIIPDDLAAHLGKNPTAAEHFNAFNPSTRRNILRWIATTRTPQTREKRISLTVTEAQQGRAAKSNG
ncbi:YdeI/OmpD-associated family protein [Cryobacterium sp. PH31-L1]|uniref:YdeI/OmpD-associated family protein n=1 Tax=Cryobacterium sp. PH31-L1 TaxID=3046199 RepID=UPI0024B91D51|nr:YdeI/OmpD-associated family protein [Cryobacterium sp. PH31-L1]MDJ0377996.1 YdeI/OmpD-associated family protein [Cryobacterium sp. PH31-L1]